MTSLCYDSKNPLFKHDFDKLCAICQKPLVKNKTHTIHDLIPRSEPKINAFQVLKSISQFRCEDGPQNVCLACFNNTVSAYKFQQICNNAYANITNYLQHQRETSQQETLEPTNTMHKSDNVKRVQCNVCHKYYRSDNMKVHMRIHTGEKPYECKICHSRFTQWSTLKYHIDMHENNRRFMCKYCGKSFNYMNHLTAHERTHTGEKPYKCDKCELAFITKACLLRHSVVHTEEKAFQCEVCSKCFNRRSTLKTHQKIHNNDKQHVCDQCGKAFIQAHSLRSHLQMHAKRDMMEMKLTTIIIEEVKVMDDSNSATEDCNND